MDNTLYMESSHIKFQQRAEWMSGPANRNYSANLIFIKQAASTYYYILIKIILEN